MSNPEWRGNRTLSLQAARCGWSRPARDTAAAHWQVKPSQTQSNRFGAKIEDDEEDEEEKDWGGEGVGGKNTGVPPI